MKLTYFLTFIGLVGAAIAVPARETGESIVPECV